MHSLTPYLLRVYDPLREVTIKKKTKKGANALLHDIYGKDLFQIFLDFMTAHKNTFIKTVDEKRRKVYKFHDVKVIDKERIIYGWFLEGEYGLEKELINIDSSDVEFVRKIENAEITRHFFYIKLPQPQAHGLVLLHNFNCNGVKTTFHDEFLAFSKPLIKLTVSMTPLSYDGAMKAWANSVAKEIRLNRFVPQDDINDTLKELGYKEQPNAVLVLKPELKGGNFGKLSELAYKLKTDKPSKKLQAVELLMENCSEIKTVFELNGKKRTFKIGNGISNVLCEVLCPKELEENHLPTLDELKSWAFEVADEFSSDIYAD